MINVTTCQQMKTFYRLELSRTFRNRDLIGGDAALDFVNTVTGRDQSPRDWLDSYARLLNGRHSCISCQKECCAHWLRKAQKEPAAAASALARAKVLREALFELVTRIIPGVPRRKPPWHCYASIGSLG